MVYYDYLTNIIYLSDIHMYIYAYNYELIIITIISTENKIRHDVNLAITVDTGGCHNNFRCHQ